MGESFLPTERFYGSMKNVNVVPKVLCLAGNALKLRAVVLIHSLYLWSNLFLEQKTFDKLTSEFRICHSSEWFGYSNLCIVEVDATVTTSLLITFLSSSSNSRYLGLSSLSILICLHEPSILVDMVLLKSTLSSSLKLSRSFTKLFL